MDSIIETLADHFREDEITTKLLKPAWVRAADILLLFLFSISVMEAGIKIEFDTFSCNMNECVYNTSQYSLQSCPQFQTVSLDADSVYSYIDDKCRQKMIPWFVENVAFIYLINAAFLFICSRLWTTLPSSALYIERFVGMVGECNDAIGTFGCAYDVIFSTDKETEQLDTFSNAHDDASDPAKLQKLLKLHKKVLSMRTDITATAALNTDDKIPPTTKLSLHNFTICVICIAQYVLLTLLSLTSFFCISFIFFWFDHMRSEYYCDLEEYSRIACIYRLYTLNLFLAVMYCTCNCFHCFLSATHLCWVIRKCRVPFQIDFQKPPALKVYGSLGLLLHLLNSNDRFFVKKFSLFMDSQITEDVKERATDKQFPLKKLKVINEEQNGLRLEGLRFKPKSFDYFHCIPNLTVLRLVNCKLEEFPSCLLSANSLIEVNLTNNLISNIPEDNQTRPDKTGILELVLDNNPLLSVTMRSIQSWKRLKALSLVGIKTEKAKASFSFEHLGTNGCHLRELIMDADTAKLTEDTELVVFTGRGQLDANSGNNVYLRVKHKERLQESLDKLKSHVEHIPDRVKRSYVFDHLIKKKAVGGDIDDKTILRQFFSGVKDLSQDALEKTDREGFGIIQRMENDMEASYISIYRYPLRNQVKTIYVQPGRTQGTILSARSSK
ncbi:volume-regulated anion channel subunit LRRC8B-like [Mizuhopecten yessoensis]|uniref:volume-regulated anion channel subunit LRRC8B-like n=1 Tax=Mizuhopecten yessoensis TaxID=6573 RepID=UPI000B45DC13|nr:volume-regulated anion channel subunit LRRC8B-like [Mizuhopecten yessoensis]